MAVSGLGGDAQWLRGYGGERGATRDKMLAKAVEEVSPQFTQCHRCGAVGVRPDLRPRRRQVLRWLRLARGLTHLSPPARADPSVHPRGLTRRAGEGVDECPAALDLGIIPWSPPANGLLAGKYTTLISVTRLAQLEDDLTALDFDIPGELAARLEEMSRPEPVYPYYFSGPGMGPVINAGAAITAG
ncbi:MAG: hypothetical protein ACRDP6_45555 [Actinoallomurus sp.]